jgi:serine/threonine-protein kinase
MASEQMPGSTRFQRSESRPQDGPGGLRISLEVIEGPHQGRVFHFTGHDTFIVGRSRRAHFYLEKEDKRLSRVHFLVEVNPPCCRLMDMNSHNGTFVNQKRVTAVDLKDGDLIRGGLTVFRVLMKADAGATPAPGRGESRLLEPPPHTLPAGRPEQTAGTTGATSSSTSERTVTFRASSEWPNIPGYQIIRELGRGGIGVVYLALRASDQLAVALKTVQPAVAVEPTEIERFLREAEILKQLKHPHIVACHEVGEADGLLYFAMDYIQGTDGAHLVKEHGPLPVPRAVGLACQLLDALEHAHQSGFVHRDIKPGNVMISQVQGKDLARLVDFGLARVYQESKMSGLTLMGETGGTLAFMAPEQISQFREALPSVDQYAAAATLYTWLTNRFVFDLPNVYHEALLMIFQDDPVSIQLRRPDVPDKLARIIHRGLEKDTAKRFANVGDLRRALRGFAV